ncbi:hypothetical protein Aduo_004295 [Ancylostoma duodenale]
MIIPVKRALKDSGGIVYSRYIVKLVLALGCFATFPVIVLKIYAHPYQTSEINSSSQNISDNGSDGGLEVDGVRFSRRPETAHVECDRVLHGDEEYMKKISKNRVNLVVRNISMTCDDLRRRIVPSVKFRPLKFGIAYARIVYESYEFIEAELRSSYHAQNVFCYSVDKKAGENFSRRINTLEECFPNIVATKARFNIDSSGHFMNHAHYECLKALVNKPGWRYVLLMQNYDVIIKTVYETVAILDKLEGSNDVKIIPCEDVRWNHSGKEASYTSTIKRLINNCERCCTIFFVTSSGLLDGKYRRSNGLIDQLNIKEYGIDEILVASLQVSEIFDMPGRFTAECMKGKHDIGFITRVAVWIWEKDLCKSRKFRHGVCIYGIEDFSWLSRHPKIMANKMMPDFDYSITDCMHELLFNRTHLKQTNDALNLNIYENLRSVRYHKNRIRPDPNYKLDCSRGI